MNSLRLKRGDFCGPYEIMASLGAGGVGDVYEAVHTYTGRPVALKCLQSRHVNDEDMTDRMRREARGLAKLNHPNIVTVLDAGTDGQTVWMAMELLSGKTLREYLTVVGRLSLEEALYVAHEIADALDAAHEFNMVHRDLKPENVFLATGFRVKLLDFGAAKFYGAEFISTDRGSLLGTPHYMSPEQILGEEGDRARVRVRRDVCGDGGGARRGRDLRRAALRERLGAQGKGGGGQGGHTLGIAHKGAAPPSTGVTIKTGTAGAGGVGEGATGSGAAGVKAATQEFP
jgi:serine/threonine protein kinase